MGDELMLDTKVSLLNIEHCVFKWAIENFFLSRDDSKFQIRSPPFKLDPYSQVMWYLDFIPKFSRKIINIGLVREDDDGPKIVDAHMKLQISCNDKNEEIKKFISLEKQGKVSIPFDVGALEAFVTDDTLRVELDMYSVSKKPLRPTKEIHTSKELVILSNDLKTFKLNEDLKDLTFKLASDKLVKGNMTILSSRSEYLKEKLKTSSVIELPTVDIDTFLSLLNFMYTGEYKLCFQKVSLHDYYQCAAHLKLNELTDLLQPNWIDSRTVIGAESCEFIWETDFNLKPKDGDFVSSVPFGSCFSKTRWTIKLYKKHKGHISMAFDCCSVTKDNPLALKISLIDEKEKPIFTYQSIKPIPSYGRQESLTFIDENLLPTSGVLHNGKVRVMCKLKFATDKITSNVENNVLSKPLCCSNGYDSLCGDLEILYQSKYRSDFQIKCDGKIYDVHKCILLARCPDFYSEVVKNCVGKVVRIDGTDSATFEKFLKLVYTGFIDHGNDLKTVLKLFDLSAMPSLKEECLTIIQSKFKPETICDLLREFSDPDYSDIKYMAIAYACSTAEKIMFTEQWKTLAEEKPQVAKEVVLMLVRKFNGTK